MFRILALATLALAEPAPITIQFTGDSVYKYESIISPKELIEQENGLYTLILEQEHLLGYCIYDNSETEYLDGLKFDDNFVTNLTIKDVDFSVEHTIFIKTVYTEDIAGTLAAAKDGDWSKLLSNPLVLLQVFYYLLAAVSLVVSGVLAWKTKNKKAKTADEIAATVGNKANDLKEQALSLINSLVLPVFTKLQTQNQSIIEALVLAQSGDKDSKMALINLLKDSATEDVSAVANTITHAIEEASTAKEMAKEEANKVLEELTRILPEGEEVRF